jgi:hypothetical protein
VWFVFAKASFASGRTYYLLNGYDVDSKPASADQQYTAGGSGFILGVNGDKCEVLDGDARQLFSARVFDDEFPFDMMQRLAADFAARLAKAYGGARAPARAGQTTHSCRGPARRSSACSQRDPRSDAVMFRKQSAPPSTRSGSSSIALQSLARRHDLVESRRA